MERVEDYFKSSDGVTDIHEVVWVPDEKPKAIIQISHGVTEHIGRYEEFAKYFTSKGFLVVGIDTIGHGYSIADSSVPMYFGGVGSWKCAVDDIGLCHDRTVDKYPDLPYCLLGFSLGSFLARAYVFIYSDCVDALVLVGTGNQGKVSLGIAKAIANHEARVHGEKNSTKMINRLTLDEYNKRFKVRISNYDWLYSSVDAMEAYRNDSLVGKEFTSGLFRELLSCMQFDSNKKNIRSINKDLPVMCISGVDDPVGNMGRGVAEVVRKFRECGIKDVEIVLYPGLRHDILHDRHVSGVHSAIYSWLFEKILSNV